MDSSQQYGRGNLACVCVCLFVCVACASMHTVPMVTPTESAASTVEWLSA